MKLFLLLSAIYFPLTGQASPVAEAKNELKTLARLCPKLPAAGGSCPSLKKAAMEAEKHCHATHKSYSAALEQARAKVNETKEWMATKQMVNETEDYIYISFNLSDDPSYPMIDSENIVNDALGKSLKNIYAVEEAVQKIREKRSCDEREIQRFVAAWDDPKKETGVGRAHDRLAEAISRYLVGAMRAFESGAHEDAIKALERETGAKVNKVK